MYQDTLKDVVETVSDQIMTFVVRSIMMMMMMMMILIHRLSLQTVVLSKSLTLRRRQLLLIKLSMYEVFLCFCFI